MPSLSRLERKLRDRSDDSSMVSEVLDLVREYIDEPYIIRTNMDAGIGFGLGMKQIETVQRRDEPAGQQKKYRGDRQVDEVHVHAPYRDVKLSVARFARNTYPSGRQPATSLHASSLPLHTQGNAQKVKTV